MNRTMLVAIATLLVLPVLSGCLGGDDAPKKAENKDCPDDVCGDAKVDDATGCIVGKVNNENLEPLEGAEVKLRELDFTATTTATGGFVFCKLTPGVFNIYASAAGHEAASKEVTVVAGEEASGDIALISLPPASTPVMSGPVDYGGYMGCTISTGNGLRGDVCSNIQTIKIANQQPFKNENQRNNFYPAIDVGLSALAIGLDADVPPPTSSSDKLTYRIWWDNPPGHIPEVIGQDGVSEVLEFEPAPWQQEPRGYDKKNEDGTTSPTAPAHVYVELAPIDDPQFTADHRFDLYLTFFYNGYPVPSDYSPLPDA